MKDALTLRGQCDESGWEKVTTSLEHCVPKFIESSEKIVLTNVS